MTTYTRPNGKTYRPRNPDQRILIPFGDIGGPKPYGVAVIGTDNPDDAQPRADGFLQWVTGNPNARAVAPVVGWWRKGYKRSGLVLLEDDVRGRPGVLYVCRED